jgi:hypothetical protein
MKMKRDLIVASILSLSIFLGGLGLSQALISSAPTPTLDAVVGVNGTTSKAVQVGDLTVTGTCTGCGGTATIPTLTEVLKEGNTATESVNLSGILTVSTIAGNSTNTITFGSNAYGYGWDSNSNTFRLYNSTYPAAYLFSANLPFGAMGGVLVTDNISANDPSLMLYSIPSQHTAVLQLGSADVSATGSLQMIGLNGANFRRATINPNTGMAGDITLMLPATTGTFALTSQLGSYVAKSGDTMTGALTINNNLTTTGTSLLSFAGSSGETLSVKTTNKANSSVALWVNNSGGSDAFYPVIDNATSTGVVINVENMGLGAALALSVDNVSNASYVIGGYTTGTGDLINLSKGANTFVVDNNAVVDAEAYKVNGSAGIDFTQIICCTYSGLACTATGTATFSKGILTAETCP